MWLHTETRSVGDIPRYYARVAPDHPALIDRLGTSTFGELDEASSRIASAIVASGITPGSHLGFLGKNSARYFELFFGAVKAGCALVPLNWRLAPPELAAVIDDARTPLVFVDEDVAALLASIDELTATPFGTVRFDSSTPGLGAFERWLSVGDGADPNVPIHPDDTAVLIYTSGTTGRAKGVQITHRALDGIRLCEHLEPAFVWTEEDTLLTVMPVFHLVGTGLSLQALYNGATVSLLPQLDPAELLEALGRDRPTICALVPTAIQAVVDHPDAADADFSSLRLVMYAGSPISAAVLKRAIVTMGCDFMQFYGATESCGALTLLRPEQHDVDDEQRLRSCGTPLPLIEIRIVDPQGEEVPDGSTGEFVVRGPNLFGGYWQQPDATAAVLQDGWYRTGDAGYRDAEGLMYILDRVKDMIVTGGENVYAAEVEQALAAHPDVAQCAVVGMPDEQWGERITAAVIPRDDAQPEPDVLVAHCRELIAGYKVPKEIRLVETLPMTATGKILKREVRDQLHSES